MIPDKVSEDTLLLEASNELFDGGNFYARLADRRLLDHDGFESSFNVYAKLLGFNLIDSLLTCLEGIKTWKGKLANLKCSFWPMWVFEWQMYLHDVLNGQESRCIEAKIAGDDRRKAHGEGFESSVHLASEFELLCGGIDFELCKSVRKM